MPNLLDISIFLKYPIKYVGIVFSKLKFQNPNMITLCLYLGIKMFYEISKSQNLLQNLLGIKFLLNDRIFYKKIS